jgi:hypothetical protein
MSTEIEKKGGKEKTKTKKLRMEIWLTNRRLVLVTPKRIEPKTSIPITGYITPSTMPQRSCP